MSQIAEYKQTEAALSELRDLYSLVPDAETKEGYAACKEAAKHLRGYRTSLESMRKELKAPALERSRAIDSEAKRITAELVSLEDPMALAYKAVDAEKKRIKEEAEQRELDNIEAIRQLARDAYGKSSAEVAASIETVANVSLEFTPAKFLELANNAKNQTLSDLDEIMRSAIAKEQEDARQAIEAERIAKERAELDQLRAEQEERDRIESERLRAEQENINEQNRKIEEQKLKERLEAEAKERAEQELKDRQEAEALAEKEQEQALAHQAAMAPDKEKLESFAANDIAKIMISIPEVSSDEAKALTDRIMANLKTLQAKIIKESKLL